MANPDNHSKKSSRPSGSPDSGNKLSSGGQVERDRIVKPTEGSELKQGARLLREVLRAIPPELDEPEDAVLREIVKGAANAADVAAKLDELERPPEV